MNRKDPRFVRLLPLFRFSGLFLWLVLFSLGRVDDGQLELRVAEAQSITAENGRSAFTAAYEEGVQLYLEDGTPLDLNNRSVESLELMWASSEMDDTFSVAWGDWDNDGDLDLAMGNFWEHANFVYENEDGVLKLDVANGLGWQSDEQENTASVAWGDWDNDGDLDLAVGNAPVNEEGGVQPDRVYENDGQTLRLAPSEGWGWVSPENDETRGIAWGDWDNDGDLDLAVGNKNEPNHVYENDGDTLRLEPDNGWGWTSDEADYTTSVAWGDWDNDGDLDLAVGNRAQANKIYENDAGIELMFDPLSGWGWLSSENDETRSVAWADWDGDGDLDLAAGNDGITRVYANRLVPDGAANMAAVWGSATEFTFSVVWGDWDGDGDLDLATGNNYGRHNKIYENDASLDLRLDVANGWGWMSPDTGYTRGLAWGDWDRDGDLDLAIGRINTSSNQLFANGGSHFESAWVSEAAQVSVDVAWGDWDGDGDLDLAVANYRQPNRVYENDGGILRFDPEAGWGWVSDEADDTESVAWGDWDNDGDLDLAAGNGWGDENRVYENDGGTLHLSWSSVDVNETQRLVWGDWDNDGDLDLVAGNGSDQANLVYENQYDRTGVPGFEVAWVSEELSYTQSVAWGDWDNDGDLDLAVGNDFAQADLVYENIGGDLEMAWAASNATEVQPEDNTLMVAWGDVNGDGYLDLAVGTSETSRVYENRAVADGGRTLTPIWRPNDANGPWGLAWGDLDADSDLDLVLGNTWGDPRFNHLYENEQGVLQAAATWTAPEADSTWGVADGDWDGDGDRDLAIGNTVGDAGGINRVYANRLREVPLLVDNPSYIKVARPGESDEADFYSVSEIVKAGVVAVGFKLFDPESHPVRSIRAYYSPNGGGLWLPASPAEGAVLADLTTSPTGVAHQFLWDAEADLIRQDNVVFRIDVYQGYAGAGPYQWPAQLSHTFPFRLEATPWYAKVVDEHGQAVQGAQLYYEGRLLEEQSDQAGLLRLERPATGQPLVALLPVAEQATVRGGHAGWAYRTYVTSLNLDADGLPQPDTVGGQGEQRVVVRPDDALILFNLVVSIEWDADDSYLAMMERAFERASAYLYDVTDGQMAFGEVRIYDNRVLWANADFQVSTKNTVRPYAFVAGITSEDTAHAIRVGRFWDSASGETGSWDAPNGYRTLIHEFGHYALHLHDEYFVRLVDENGYFRGIAAAACTGLEIIDEEEAPTNASMMYYQYRASELAGDDRWGINCQHTEQARVHGESDWQTVYRIFDGADWEINTPTSRGSVMAGPDRFPTELLPFPLIEQIDSGGSPPLRRVMVQLPDGQPARNALVALHTTRGLERVVLDQGLTNVDGLIDVLGADEGDTVRVVSLDGVFVGEMVVGPATKYVLTLAPAPTSWGHQSSPRQQAIEQLNRGGGVRFDVVPDRERHLVSQDGRLALFVAKGGVEDAFSVSITPVDSRMTRKVGDVVLISDAYDVSAMGSARLSWARPALLTMAYQSSLVGTNESRVAVYRWDSAGEAWVALGGDVIEGSVTVPIERFGIFAVGLVEDNVWSAGVQTGAR